MGCVSGKERPKQDAKQGDPAQSVVFHPMESKVKGEQEPEKPKQVDEKQKEEVGQDKHKESRFEEGQPYLPNSTVGGEQNKQKQEEYSRSKLKPISEEEGEPASNSSNRFKENNPNQEERRLEIEQLKNGAGSNEKKIFSSHIHHREPANNGMYSSHMRAGAPRETGDHTPVNINVQPPLNGQKRGEGEDRDSQIPYLGSEPIRNQRVSGQVDPNTQAFIEQIEHKQNYTPEEVPQEDNFQTEGFGLQSKLFRW